MKREMELIRAILLAVESDEDPSKLEGYDANTIKYHKILIIERELVRGSVQDTIGNKLKMPTHVDIESLTWEGHEFLDAVRDASVWNTIKSDFKDAGLSTVISVSKQLAEGYAKKKVEGLLKGDATA